MRTILAVVIFPVLLAGAIAQTSQTSPSPLTYIRAGHLFDPASGQYLDNATLVIANHRVQSVDS